MAPASDLAATLSASSIQHYETCPLQFKLERECRIPAEAYAALQYGACMHRLLLTYYESIRLGRTKTDEELLDLFKNDPGMAVIPDEYQRKLYLNQGLDQLRNFLASTRSEAAPEALRAGDPRDGERLRSVCLPRLQFLLHVCERRLRRAELDRDRDRFWTGFRRRGQLLAYPPDEAQAIERSQCFFAFGGR